MKQQKIRIFLIAMLLTIQLSQAQKAVVSLPSWNIVYIGLDNPLQIAVEGYTNDQITVTAEGYDTYQRKLESMNMISHVNSQNYILKVSTNGTCLVNVSYKDGDSIKTETKEFIVRSVPKPVSKFGGLESGPCWAYQLLNQYTINAVLPNFYFKGVEFIVLKYEILYVPTRGEAQSFSIKGNQIPLEVKQLISVSRPGDKILVDEIQAIGPGGITRRLNPLAITIDGQPNKLIEISDFYTYQENKNSKIDTLMYSWDYEYYVKKQPYIIKGYSTQCGKTNLIFEVKKNNNKVLWEKHYYVSGKLKSEYNFESNDTLGTAISFYENGVIKSTGKLVTKNFSISEYYSDRFVFAGVPIINLQLLDSFLFHNYTPFGEWKGYYENGNLALECTLNIYYCGKIPMKEEEREIYPGYCNASSRRQASIKEAFDNKDSFFNPKFTGSFKLYDREGKIIKEENFKD